MQIRYSKINGFLRWIIAKHLYRENNINSKKLWMISKTTFNLKIHKFIQTSSSLLSERTTKRTKLTNPITFPNQVRRFEAPTICMILHIPEYIRRSTG